MVRGHYSVIRTSSSVIVAFCDRTTGERRPRGVVEVVTFSGERRERELQQWHQAFFARVGSMRLLPEYWAAWYHYRSLFPKKVQSNIDASYRQEIKYYHDTKAIRAIVQRYGIPADGYATVQALNAAMDAADAADA